MIEALGVGVVAGSTSLLTDVVLRVEAGEWVSVIGPNGAGKSTLLRALAGVMDSSGELQLAGRPSEELSRRERAKLVAWVPQTPTIPAGVTVVEYVLLGRTPHLHALASESAEDLEIADEVIARLDLDALRGRFVDTLSGGEMQRAVIGRALAQQAPILLLDEPTAALDLGHQQDLLALLSQLQAGGDRTIITTMHDLTLAGAFADRVLMLAGGRVVANGRAPDVLTAELIESHYGARVRLDRSGEHLVVIPRL